MTEVQAAIGRVQLRRLPAWVERRRRNAAILTERLEAIPALRVTRPPNHAGHACYKYYAFVRPERLAEGWDRDRLLAAITAEASPALPAPAPRSIARRRSTLTEHGAGRAPAGGAGARRDGADVPDRSDLSATPT